jgi:Barstar (barnase inhibitor)
MSGRLASVLTGARPPGVYRWLSRAHIEPVRRELAAAGWASHPLDGWLVAGEQGLMDWCARSLSLPTRFSRTWAGVTEGLLDLSWLPERGHVVLWEAYAVLARTDPALWRRAYELFVAAAEGRDPAGAPLYVLLRGTGPAVRPDGAGPIPAL